LRNIINPNDKTIGISLLGISILTGFVDQQYGQALTVRFKINTNDNFVINQSDNNLEFEDRDKIIDILWTMFCMVELNGYMI